MIGKKLKNYQIEELLGEGGMGVVYRAKDVNLNRDVAIKMLHPEMLHQPDLLERFKNEAHVTARLSHPNIATLYNFISDGELHCLVMEFVNGKTVEDILSVHKKIPESECIRILMQLLEGLGEAHANGILHRDIKPGNIMINHAGYVKLMDFGVARFENSARMTRMNRVIGTLEYMAPELLTGGSPSVQADLYSVGVVAFEMCTGQLPFDAANDADMTEQILRGRALFAGKTGFSIPGKSSRLEKVIQKLMNKNRNRRYLSTADVLDDLANLQVTGRISSQLFGNKMIQTETEPQQTGGAFFWKEPIESIQNEVGTWFAKFTPLAKQFAGTTEGKIIAAATGIALLIMLASAMFTGSEPQSANTDPSEKGLSEEFVTSEQAGNNSVGSNSIQPVIPEIRDQSPVDRPRVMNPVNRGQVSDSGNPSESETTQDNGNGQDESGGIDDNETGSREDSEEQSNSGNRSVNESSGEARSEKTEESEPEAAPGRVVNISVSNSYVVGIFSENVSTNTHSPGDRFYLTVAGAVYKDGYKVIESGAKIRGIVQNVRVRGATRRATLAVAFESVEAVDGTWLPISYPEYSNQATGSVTFERGRAINRLRIESGTVTLAIN